MKYAIFHSPSTGKAGAVSSESLDLLQKHLDDLPGDFFGCVAELADGLTMNGPTLVKVYNALAAEHAEKGVDGTIAAPVTKFQDLKVAKRRVFELVVKTATRIADAPSKDDAIIEKAAAAMQRKAARDAAKAAKASKPVGLRKKCDDYPLNAVITVIVDKNPKRPGSVSEQRFACYKTGQTVEDYLRAGGRGLDVKWDVEHEFIRVTVPDRG